MKAPTKSATRRARSRSRQILLKAPNKENSASTNTPANTPAKKSKPASTITPANTTAKEAWAMPATPLEESERMLAQLHAANAALVSTQMRLDLTTRRETAITTELVRVSKKTAVDKGKTGKMVALRALISIGFYFPFIPTNPTEPANPCGPTTTQR
jgi:hypothetical protein